MSKARAMLLLLPNALDFTKGYILRLHVSVQWHELTLIEFERRFEDLHIANNLNPIFTYLMISLKAVIITTAKEKLFCCNHFFDLLAKKIKYCKNQNMF